MPIYEYRCPSCGETFEQRRPMSQATDPAACPSCQTASPRIVSRLARVSSGGDGGDGGEDEAGSGMGDDLGGAGFSGGHGHSHGPMGHGH